MYFKIDVVPFHPDLPPRTSGDMRKPHTKEVKIGEAFPRDDRIEFAIGRPIALLGRFKSGPDVLEPKCWMKSYSRSHVCIVHSAARVASLALFNLLS